MRADVLSRHLEYRPFQPFRIVLSDGVAYEIRHPDQARVNRADLEVLVQDSETRKLEGDFVVSVSYLHIVRLEPILPPAIEALNGTH